MDHKFKNEQINKILSDHENYNIAVESADSMEKAAEIMRKLSTEELGNAILGGYYSSLVEVAGWNDVFPEPSYDQLDKLAPALAMLYSAQRESYSPRENAEIIGKTIAAYMALLCINETGCVPQYSRINPMMYASQADIPEAWGGAIIIEVGSRKPVDFYQAGLDAVKEERIAMDDGLAVDMTPVIIAYRRATGIKLSEYGLANLMIGGKE